MFKIKLKIQNEATINSKLNFDIFKMFPNEKFKLSFQNLTIDYVIVRCKNIPEQKINSLTFPDSILNTDCLKNLIFYKI